jgi:hypothetical protein
MDDPAPPVPCAVCRHLGAVPVPFYPSGLIIPEVGVPEESEKAMNNSRTAHVTMKRTCPGRILIMACLMLASVAIAGERNWPQAGEGSSTSYTPAPAPQGVTADWHYTLTARVRPLLFWISRENVGGAHIAGTEGADGSRTAELLIGSDPARAPMRINRWGYIGERVAGPTAEILGVMTTSDEESIGQAKAGLAGQRGAHAFKAIRGGLKDGVAYSTVMHLLLTDDFTYRDAEELFRQLPPAGGVTRRKDVPAGVEPGFLFAVKGLLHEIVGSYNRSGRVSARRTRRIFVYNSCLYELMQEESRFQPETLVGGRVYKATIESKFKTRNTATGETSGFVITCGTRAPIEEAPVRIVYRPRWWFETELLLQDGADVLAVAGATPWTSLSR